MSGFKEKEILQNYKQTEIGRIPKEWKVMKLGELFYLEYGKGLTEKKRENGEYPVYGSNGIVGYHSRYIVKGPGIIVGRKGTIGSITWSNNNFWSIDTTYYILLKKPEIDLKWLFYKLLLLKLERLNMATGTPGLNRDLVYRLKIHLPPLPEQRKIAEILSTVDRAIEKVDSAIAKTEQLKKGLMQELLTKGIGHKEFKDTEIGRIPRKWEISKLGNVADIETGKRDKGGCLSEGVVASIGGEHIDLNGNILWDRMKFITESFYKTLKQGKVKSGDILMVKDGATTGKACFVRNLPYEKVAINEHVFLIRSKKEVINEFLFYILFSKVGQTQIKIRFHGLIGGIKRGDIKSLTLHLPPLPEQQKIAEILSTVDRKIELLREKKERLERVEKGLMNVLLTGKKRVKY
ncbi:restriction endonuclease subunit S [candidate division KSB1 bacterium]|nr:MAG: restriction endonuclease subunit S [candidate division KSB1 bacterium]